MNEMKLKELFVVLAACLLATVRGRLVNEKRAVGVEVDLPWFVQFAVPVGVNFVPLSLTAHLRATTDGGVPVDATNTDFSLHCDRGRVIFRNTTPLRLRPNVPLLARLRYGTGGPGEREVRQMNFTYSVQDDKQFDTLQLVAAVEQDSIPPVAVAHDDSNDFDSDDTPSPSPSPIPIPDPCLFYSNETMAQDEHEPSSSMPDRPSTTNRTPPPSRPSTTTTPTRQHPGPAPAAGPSSPTDDGLCGEPAPCPASNVAYQQALLHTAVQVGNIGLRLLLRGQQPPGSNAVNAIRRIITRKLQLPHLSQAIRQAQQLEYGLLFEMQTTHQKLEVLTKAQRLLDRSPYTIESTDLEFFDVSQYQRGDFDSS